MNIVRWLTRLVSAAIAQSIVCSLALAQAPANPEMPQACPGLVAGDRACAIRALNLATLNSEQILLTFLGHATFLIESPQLVRIATDYNDYIRAPVLPDIVTMWARVPISRRSGT
jgi:hypothetical protein